MSGSSSTTGGGPKHHSTPLFRCCAAFCLLRLRRDRLCLEPGMITAALRFSGRLALSLPCEGVIETLCVELKLLHIPAGGSTPVLALSHSLSIITRSGAQASHPLLRAATIEHLLSSGLLHRYCLSQVIGRDARVQCAGQERRDLKVGPSGMLACSNTNSESGSQLTMCSVLVTHVWFSG